jgi:hypothetical protein
MPLVPHTPAAEAQDHAALIVALDAGDLVGAERMTAESLAASCTGCAALVHDLAAIRGAMTALPVPPRRRDYRLTAEDAARLRPSGWRRLLEWLAAPGSAVRPLATGLATLGVVGLLLTSGFPGLLSGLGGSAAAPALAPVGTPIDNAAPNASGDGSGGAEFQGTFGPAAVPSRAPGHDPGTAATAAPAPEPSAAPSDPQGVLAGEGATAGPTGDRASGTGTHDGDEDSEKAAGRDATSTLPLPVVVSLALLATGLALLVGRMLARRRLS